MAARNAVNVSNMVEFYPNTRTQPIEFIIRI
jgi:hypothetical protein